MTLENIASSSTWSDLRNHHEPFKLDQDISIGVAAYGNAAATRRCLEALFKSAEGNFELILINDCSPDDGQTLSVFTWAHEMHDNTMIYNINDSNIEYSGSVNLLLSHAIGEIVIFISNDICVTPYYMRTICEFGRNTSGWGLLRGSSSFVDNGLSSHNIHPSKPITDLEDVFCESQALFSIYADLSIPDPFLTGDAFAVSRELINRIGTFDPLFYGYFADHDYGIRAKIAGLDAFLLPGAYAFHEAGANISYLSNEDRAKKTSLRWSRIHENWARFKLKYQIGVEVPYTSVHDIPWDELSSLPIDQVAYYIDAKDYSAYLAKS